MMAPASAWFLGEGSLLIQTASIWRELGHAVAGVASREPNIRAWAEQQGLELVEPDDFVKKAGAAPFDYLFSVVNLTMLRADALSLPAKLAINFHDAVLPRYAGVNATTWALLNGEATHGVTWHEMTEGADEGRLLVQRAFDIEPDETAFSLNAKCFTAGIESFRELAERIGNGTLAPTPQNLAERSYFGPHERPRSGMVLCFDEPAVALDRLVRALDFGSYPNPIGTAKVLVNEQALSVSDSEVVAGSEAAPGTVLEVSERGVVVATAGGALRLGRLRSNAGATLGGPELSALGIRPGARLTVPSAALREELTGAFAAAARDEPAIIRRLTAPAPLALPLGQGDAAAAELRSATVAVPAGIEGGVLPAAWLVFLARLSGTTTFDLGLVTPALLEKSALVPGVFAEEAPLRVVLDAALPLTRAESKADEDFRQAAARMPHALDLSLRQPGIVRERLPAVLRVDSSANPRPEPSVLEAIIDTRVGTVELRTAGDESAERALQSLAKRFATFLRSRREHASLPLKEVPLLDAEERRRILEDWNQTSSPFPEDACVHTLFEAQARKTPDRTAVSSRGVSLGYRELDRRANAVAHALVARGAAPDVLVGIYAERGVDLVTAMLAVHKAGAAYVPLDPRYPAERVRFMIEDSRLLAVVADRKSAPSLPDGTPVIVVDDGSFDAGADAPPSTSVTSSNLAYVIYTSGSTGVPKGVMVEHRNVVNFLFAMDPHLEPARGGSWLAVTSLSFDISVLEISWTLTRGLGLVVHGTHAGSAPARAVDFSVFYFSSSESGGGPEHYRLLFEGARFADENGFVAVWTPERHFHAFGGLYPNPAVTSAALAMVTKRVALRAGSCVSPLHSPLRVAEEWSLVDNLSNGRVGISFASGWQPNDFAIRPEAFANRRERMFEDIETVRRLWRGERLAFKNGNAKDVSLATLPRPVQKDLPVWVTAAGTLETFAQAGRIGANLLTHLLGQTFKEVGEKVQAYRAAWEQAGHPGRGVVTLMLHTFVGSDEAMVKETVRGPMKEYLKSAVGLIKEAAWSFPTFKTRLDQGTFTTDQLSAEEMDALLDHAFERYYSTSGLFGTVENAVAIVDQVRGLDVDEIACLIDFGVAEDLVLAHLPLLGVVRERSRAPKETMSSDEALGPLFKEHRITHFQCTPSMASMLVEDPEAVGGLAALDYMLVGGEALPPALAKKLREIVPGALINVYGPTETTVWSSSARIEAGAADVAIGRPLANNEIFILDEFGGLAPPGVEGELVIGGKGLARGYLHREELTNERFVPNPFRAGTRLYRTGDQACFDEHGTLWFRGRKDHQLKLRGYRIEIGEIEARLSEHPSVRQCVVIAREDTPGDKRLVAYVVPRGAAATSVELRSHLQERLPEYMVPSAFVVLPSLPQTPNKKVDRKALPRPERERTAADDQRVSPQSSTEELIAGIWREVLNRDQVGATENFFDLGGHSLLTIQVLGKLKPKVTRPLSLVDLFRFPTIRALADFLDSEQAPASGLGDSAARGAERKRIRQAMADRRRRD